LGQNFIDSAGELPQIVLVQKQLHFATSRPQGHQPKQIFPQFLHKKEDIQIFSSLMIVVLLI
jgi:hypothetical protein